MDSNFAKLMKKEGLLVFSHILFCLIFFNHTSVAQSQSPDAATMATGSRLIGPYTGVPDISFPITKISGRSIELPVNLIYNGGGVKVEDVASWVGLGWNLTASGSITRTIRGTDDFQGYIYDAGNIPNSISSDCKDGGSNLNPYISEVLQGDKDSEPDIFNISALGISTQFFIDESGDVRTIPRSGIKIEYNANSGVVDWIVTDLDGVKYFFGEPGTTAYTEKEGPTETAWMLRKVVTPTGEVVGFSYSTFNLNYDLRPFERYEFVISGSGACNVQDNAFLTSRDVNMQIKLLDEITLNESKLIFQKGPRCDIYGSKKLDKIIYKENDNLIREFVFSYDCNAVKQRNWLMSVREVGKHGKDMPPLRFKYKNKNSLPGIDSYAQDYWGYYNGVNTNEKLTPSIVKDGVAFSGANRNPNSTTITYGTLEEVQLPSGGRKTYEWEPHKYDNSDNPYPVYNETNIVQEVAQGNRYGAPSNGSVTFTLNTATAVKFEIMLDDLGQDPIDDFYVELTKNSNRQARWYNSTTKTLQLSSGTYQLTAVIGSNDPNIFLAIGKCSYSSLVSEGTTPGDRIGGGIRIHKIITKPDIGNSQEIVTRYEYSNFNDSHTSGKLMSGPVHHHKLRFNCTSSGYKDLLVFTSESAIPLYTSAAGSYVGYSQVTVYKSDDDSEGKTELSYINEENPFSEITNDLGTFFVPFVPPYGNFYKNGLLTKRTDYRYFNGNYYEVNEEVSTYNFTGTVSTPGLVIVDNSHITGLCTNMVYALYDLNTSYIQQTGISTTKYDGNDHITGDSITTTATFTYHNTYPWLVSGESTTNSNDVTHSTQYYYPPDYDNAVYNGVIGDMIADNKLNAVVQRIDKRTQSANTHTVGAITYVYSTFAGTQLLNNIYNLEITDPVTDFSFNSNDPLGDSRFSKIRELKYDASGNIIRDAYVDRKKALLYGYANDKVIAEVNNANNDQIAFSSFESDKKGNWNYDQGQVSSASSFTGSKSFGGNTISADVPMGNYIVSLWAKGTGSVVVNGSNKSTSDDWVYYEWVLNQVNSVSVSNNSQYVDEIRLYPVGALMKSYTYKPGIGMTSSSGFDGRPEFIVYDDFNRESLIKDHNNDVLYSTNYDNSFKLHGKLEAPANINLGQSQQWRMEFDDDLPSTITCTWDFGDGTGTKTGTLVNHTYNKLGQFTVKAVLSHAGYTPVTEYKTIMVSGQLQGSIPTTQANLGDVINVNILNSENNPPGTTYSWTTSYGPYSGPTLSYAASRLGHANISVTMSHPLYASRTVNGIIQVMGTMIADWTPPSGNVLKEDEVYGFKAINTAINPSDADYSWTFAGQGSGTGEIVNRSFSSPTISNMLVTLTVSHPDYSTQSKSYVISTKYADPYIANRVVYMGDQKLTITVDNGKAPYNYRVSYIGAEPNGQTGKNYETSSKTHTFTFSFTASKSIIFWVEDSNSRSTSTEEITIIIGPSGN